MNNDRITERYEGTYGSTASQRRARTRIHWLCGQARGDEVVDVGCSQGIASILLGREGKTVVGVDREQPAIDTAIEKLREEDPAVQDRVSFRLEDATSLAFEDQSFDCALLGEILEHQIDYRPLLDETLRVLRVGGRVVITIPYGYFPDPDHKEPLYLLETLEVLEQRLEIEDIELIEKWVGIVASKPQADRPRRPRVATWRRGLETAERRIAELTDELGHERAAVRKLRAEEDAFEEQRIANARLTERNDALEARAAELKLELQRVSAQREAREQRLWDARAQLNSARQERDRLRGELEAEAAKSAELSWRLRAHEDKARGERARLEAELDRAGTDRARLEKRGNEERKRRAGSEQRASALALELADARQAAETHRESLEAIQGSRAFALVRLAWWVRRLFRFSRGGAAGTPVEADEEPAPAESEEQPPPAETKEAPSVLRLDRKPAAPIGFKRSPKRGFACVLPVEDRRPLEERRAALDRAMALFGELARHRPVDLFNGADLDDVSLTGDVRWREGEAIDELRDYLGVVDYPDLHPNPNERAIQVLRLTASAIPVIVPEPAELRGVLDQELLNALEGVSGESLLDEDARERISVQLRRAALRGHSHGRAFVDLGASAGLKEIARPELSVLFATKRERFLETAIAQINRQTYEARELVCVLHGDQFSPGVEDRIEAMVDGPLTLIRAPAELTLGDALNVGVDAAAGELISKMDDDDWYGSEHLWDLVLAKSYSGAELVGKGMDFVYLEELDVLMRRCLRVIDKRTRFVAGPTLLIGAAELAELGGWRPVPRAVDQRLKDDVIGQGGKIFRTHSRGFIQTRHARGHTWDDRDPEYFLAQARRLWPGLPTQVADVEPVEDRAGKAAPSDRAHAPPPSPPVLRLDRKPVSPIGFKRSPEGGFACVLPVEDPRPLDARRAALNRAMGLIGELARHRPVDIFNAGGLGDASLPDGVERRAGGAIGELRDYVGVVDYPDLHHDLSDRATQVLRVAATGIPVIAPELSEIQGVLDEELLSALESVSAEDLLDEDERERVSLRQRRATLRGHSHGRAWVDLGARAGLKAVSRRQLSVLFATKRERFLEAGIAQINRQTYDARELVCVLHGEEFGPGVEDRIEAMVDGPLTLVRVPTEKTFGEALNAGVDAAAGELISKMDDDDWYGSEHLWDLVLAKSYSGADLIGKGGEFVYLEEVDVMIRRHLKSGERKGNRDVAGATLTFSKHFINDLGGWRPVHRFVDQRLIDDVIAKDGSLYRTHGLGFVINRHGDGHAWGADSEYFLSRAERQWEGLDHKAAALDGYGETAARRL